MNSDLKARTWASVGLALPLRLSGPEAGKLFYKLRQRFGKERRKVRESAPRSGAGAGQPSYKPDWPLYQELLFLTDVIQQRERTATYKAKPAGAAKGKPQFVAGNGGKGMTNNTGLGLSRCSTPMVPQGTNNFVFQVPGSSIPGTSHQTGFHTVHEDDLHIADLRDVDISTIELPADESQSSVSTSSVASTAHSMPKAPEADYSYKQRKRDMDKINKQIEQSSQGINKLASNLSPVLEKAAGTGALSAPLSGFTQFTPGMNAMLTAIGFAITKVKEDEQLSCLVDVLGLVNGKYVEK